jgi:hypothetical protein
MTSQGSASGRFTRAIQQRNLFMAEIALREMSRPSLIWALDYVILLAELQPAKATTTALRWHGRLELEAPTLTLAEAQFALAALVALCDSNRDAIGVLKRLLRKVRPTFGSTRKLVARRRAGFGRTQLPQKSGGKRERQSPHRRSEPQAAPAFKDVVKGSAAALGVRLVRVRRTSRLDAGEKADAREANRRAPAL